MVNIGVLSGRIELTDAASPTLANVGRGVDVLGTKLSTIGSSLTRVGSALAVGVTVPLVAAGAAIGKFGIDAVESENLVSVSFGNMRKAADDWSRRLSADLGLNQFDMRQTAGVLFNMTTGMGLSRDAAFELSTGVAELAADMSSFRNIPMEEALGKIRSGLVGETEPLKAIGILIDEATVKTYAYTHGIAEQGVELTQQQKVMARWGAILQQTSNDQGDLARTLDSPANQLRIMKTRLTEAATALGVQLVPYISKATTLLADLTPHVQSAVEWFGDLPGPVKTAGVGLGVLAATAGPAAYLLGSLAGAVSNLLPLLRGLSGVNAIGSLAPIVGLLSNPFVLAGVAALAGGAFAISRFNAQLAEMKARAAEAGPTVRDLNGNVFMTIDAAREAAAALPAATGPMRIASVSLSTALGGVSDAWTREIAAQQQAASARSASTASQEAAAKAAERHREQLEELTAQLSGSSLLADAKRYESALTAIGGTSQLTAEETSEVVDTYEKVIDKYKLLGTAGAPVVRHFENLVRAMRPVPPVIEEVAVDLTTLGQRVDPRASLNLSLHQTGLNIDGLRRAGFHASATLKDMGVQIGLLPNVTSQFADTIRDVREEMEQAFTDQMVQRLDGLAASLGNVDAAWARVGQTVVTAVADMIDATDTQSRAAIALQTSANLLGNGTSGGYGRRVAGGALQGAASGMQWGWQGAAVGAVAGGVMGFLGAQSDERRVNDMRDAFIDAAGGLHQLNVDAQAVGLTLHDLLDADTPEEFALAITELETAFERLSGAVDRYGLSLADMADEQRRTEGGRGMLLDLVDTFNMLTRAGYDAETVLARMGGDFQTMLADLNEAGILDPLLDELVEAGSLSANIANQLRGMEQAVDYEALTQKASEYGITLEGLGPSFQQANISSSAQTILDDFNALTGAGADVGGVLLGMSDEINELVNDAIKFGSAIPTAMQPLVQNLFDTGQLVDENGNRIEDLSGITFADSPLEEGIDNLNDAIRELIDALTGRVPNAIEQMGRLHVPTLKIPYQFEQQGGAPDVPNFDFSLSDEAERMHGGKARVLPFIVAHSGLAADEVPAILQTGEAVLNRDAAASLGDATVRALNAGTYDPGESNVVSLEEARATRAEMAAIKRLLQRQEAYFTGQFTRDLARATDGVLSKVPRR